MFKTMTSVLDLKKTPSDDEIKKIPSYIFLRWLSGSMYTIGAANMINMYSDIPIENQFFMIRNAFGGKVKYIPYPKQESQDELKKEQYISNFFNISLQKAHEYMDLISAEELELITQMYTQNETKKVKK